MKKLIIWLKKPKPLRRILRKIIKLFFFEQWILLIAPRNDPAKLNWKEFKPILPPKSSFWADPFLLQEGGRQYVFYEDLPFETGRGFIACMTLNEKMQVIDNRPVLKRPYHLSYPFLFQYNGALYMLPESKESGQIELYRCETFPDQWVLDRILIKNIAAVDTTLLNFDNQWWLFANIEEEGGSSWDTLHLFYANNPLSTDWKAHPKNPIIQNIENSRPAGRIFKQGNKLIRPAQDCSVRYGYATKFNHIKTLSKTEYQEELLNSFKPKPFSKYYATHTWNQSEKLRIIDAQQWRSKYF